LHTTVGVPISNTMGLGQQPVSMKSGDAGDRRSLKVPASLGAARRTREKHLCAEQNMGAHHEMAVKPFKPTLLHRR
jgi:hypothetical protein